MVDGEVSRVVDALCGGDGECGVVELAIGVGDASFGFG